MNPNPLWQTLLPLRESFCYNDVEEQLRQMTLDLYDAHIAAEAADVNVLGMAHLGSEDLVRRILQVDGLALPQRENSALIHAYLYRAWKGRNSGRGLHFLRTVLQLFFPGQWQVAQQTQAKNLPYPTALQARDNDEDATRYLTSRLSISVTADGENGSTLGALAPILRAILPARFVPRFYVGQSALGGISQAAIGGTTVVAHLKGNLLPYQANATAGISQAAISDATIVAHIKATMTATIPIGVPPIAQFTVDGGASASAAIGDSVQFTDTSQNTPTAWLWDFGDGSSSTTQNPTHVYVSRGLKTIALTASNGAGADTETRGALTIIQGFAGPYALENWTVSAGATGGDITVFADTNGGATLFVPTGSQGTLSMSFTAVATKALEFQYAIYGLYATGHNATAKLKKNGVQTTLVRLSDLVTDGGYSVNAVAGDIIEIYIEVVGTALEDIYFDVYDFDTV